MQEQLPTRPEIKVLSCGSLGARPQLWPIIDETQEILASTAQLLPSGLQLPQWSCPLSETKLDSCTCGHPAPYLQHMGFSCHGMVSALSLENRMRQRQAEALKDTFTCMHACPPSVNRFAGLSCKGPQIIWHALHANKINKALDHKHVYPSYTRRHLGTAEVKLRANRFQGPHARCEARGRYGEPALPVTPHPGCIECWKGVLERREC
eukprot:scaffold16604_cov18-Tisochrysis_lutea.AAC.2